jgi:NAD(P)H-flavin reductase
MNIFKSVVTSDLLVHDNIKEIRIKRTDNYPLSLGFNIVIDFLGFKRPYTIAYFNDDTIVILIKNERLKSRGFTKKLFENSYNSKVISYEFVSGNFTFEKNDILCISSGIGITPFIQFLSEDLSDNRKYLHYHFCKDDQSQFYEKYLGFNSKLIVSSDKLKVDIIDTNPFDIIYICGSGAFVEFIKQKFTGDTNVITESFEFNPKISGNYLHINDDALINYEGADLVDYLNKNNISVLGNCFQGICGSCVKRYRNADIEHNDLILSDDERENLFTPCCSKILSKSIEIII